MLDLEKVSAEAADWFVRLMDRPVLTTTREGFARWIVQSPTRVQAYLAVARTWNEIDRVVGLPSPSQLLKEAGGSAELAGDGADARARWKVHAIAASIAIVVVALGWVAWQAWLGDERIETAVGEQRSITLADGSVLQLNTDSELTYGLSSYERRIHLVRGEAQFFVAKDTSRPFIVTTSQAHVRAVGTIFDVQTGEQRTAVMVIEGRVEVTGKHHTDVPARDRSSAENQPSVERVVLKAGEGAAVTSAGSIRRDSSPSLQRMSAWPQRRLTFHDETLADVVAEFNRYTQHPIRIADPELAAFRITGSFATYDPSSLIEYLEKYEGIVAEKEPEGGQVLFAADLVRVQAQ